jgi:hypothetical protein
MRGRVLVRRMSGSVGVGVRVRVGAEAELCIGRRVLSVRVSVMAVMVWVVVVQR